MNSIDRALEDKNMIDRQRLARNERIATGLLLAVIFMMPSAASAAPWDDMADNVLDLLTNGFSRTIAIIVCISLGFAAWVAKLTWGMAGRFVGGIVFIFGAASIVDLFIDGVA
jgi:type IV secretion system protein VirB2